MRFDSVARRSFASRVRTPGLPGARPANDMAGPVIVDYANLEHVDTAAHAVAAR